MIKLLPLLSEILSFSQVKQIGIDTYSPEETNNAIQAATIMGKSNPVLWRHMPNELRQPLGHVDNPTRSFKGQNLGSDTILQDEKLKITNPVFAYFDKDLGTIHGRNSYIVILKSPYRMYQSDEVNDIMAYAQKSIYKIQDLPKGGGTLKTSTGEERSDEEIIDKAKKGAATYEEITDGKPLIPSREVVIQAKEYWLINPGALTHEAIIGKFGKDINLRRDDVTYGDVIDALYKYKSYQNFLSKNK